MTRRRRTVVGTAVITVVGMACAVLVPSGMASGDAAQQSCGGPTGYWLAAADGGVFAFGGAHFAGSMGGKALAKPIIGMAPSPTGNGYYLLGADGGIFNFGDAPYLGSMGGTRLNSPIAAMVST